MLLFRLNMKRTTFSYQLTPKQQKTLQEVLTRGPYRQISEPHAAFAAEGDGVRISVYASGKCVVQGRNAEEFVLFTLEPHVLKKAELGYEHILHPESYKAHAGVDESGKGDYFGPLVIGAVYLTPETIQRLVRSGIRDSKLVSSNRRLFDLEQLIKKSAAGQVTVTIGPAKYNQMYRRIRNVNRILAWGHARAIENLLEANPACSRVVCDKFAHEYVVAAALMKKGRSVQLQQKHGAESDPAVAAASILARAAFVRYLDTLEKKYGLAFPPGASGEVVEAAVRLVEKHGAAELSNVAKCHFRTTYRVLEKAGIDLATLPLEMAELLPEKEN